MRKLLLIIDFLVFNIIVRSFRKLLFFLKDIVIFLLKVVSAFFIIYYLNGHFVVAAEVTKHKQLSVEQVSTQIDNTQIANAQAQYFRLSIKDINKVKTLRSQFKGLISKDITDIEVLGIFAKTDVDKVKYARLFAQTFRETTKKVLDFQQFVAQANLDLYDKTSMFDYAVKPKPKKRLSHSININTCNDQCIADLQAFLKNSKSYPVDLYFINAKTDDDIRLFANKLNITPQQVNSRQITLNYAQEK